MADQKDKKEPIKWRVLSVDGDDAFLLAEQILDAQPCHTADTSVTWDTCSLRTWLNSIFYRNAFSLVEQSAVRTTTVVNEDVPLFEQTVRGKNTEDKVYLLSAAEVKNVAYGFSTEWSDSETRYAKNTKYAEQQGALTYFTGYGDWWLRTPSYRANLFMEVFCGEKESGERYSGFVNYVGGNVASPRGGIRPALHINLKALSDALSTAQKKPASMKGTQKQKTVTAPGRVKSLKAKNKKKKSALLTWKKVSGAKGYQLQYAANKKFKKKKSRLMKKKKYTVKKLKKKKTYYFRVRAYKLDGKKKVYGKWSKVKKLKIKK